MGNKETLEGILTFHSETGTEGGYWAFQDSRYINYNVPSKYCNKCGIDLDQPITPERLFEMEQAYDELGVKFNPCEDGKHEPRILTESWDYKGLHVLKDKDYLTIYHPDTKEEVWSGLINLKQYDVFKEDALGFWIHADQKGIERDEWAEYFFENFSAELKKGKEYVYE
ncbi:MAG TPA: hypothetical protein ENL19_00730, partial [candidate division WOR-3 bacterium]|nr:hypothetical protein [candidate division WOR-3 bacterium]